MGLFDRLKRRGMDDGIGIEVWKMSEVQQKKEKEGMNECLGGITVRIVCMDCGLLICTLRAS